MGEGSKIEWTDHTFNPWWGCTRVSPACDHCYAATMAKRWDVGWGTSAAPRVFGDKHWNDPIRWDRAASKAGVRARVFCASMADVFEARDGGHGATLDAQRARLWPLVEATPNLDWLLLTKRPENVLDMIPERWRGGLPSNVWMGATVENQEQADRRIPHLLRVPARVRFLSCEPLLGPLDLSDRAHGGRLQPSHMDGLSWVITGGESGPGARPSHPDWFRAVRNQCEAAGVPYFHKQNGDWTEAPDDEPIPVGARFVHQRDGDITNEIDLICDDDGTRPTPSDIIETVMVRTKKKAAGRLLDGRAWDGLPDRRR